MAQVINTNVGALFAGAALNKSAIGLQTAQQRLSSGLRINSSKDDATGLGIATGYDTQIRGTNIAIRNANDAISKAQTNDGYGAQITENLQRLYEIAVQLGGTAAGAETDRTPRRKFTYCRLDHCRCRYHGRRRGHPGDRRQPCHHRTGRHHYCRYRY